MAGTYLLRTLTSTGNRKLWTWSAWIKKAISDGTEMGLFGLYEDGANYFRIRYKSDQRLAIDNVEGNTTTMSLILGTEHRDVSGWYHLVVKYDSAQSTASNRVKIYVNGVLQTVFQTSTYPSQSANTYFPVNALPINVGRTTNNKYFDGSMSHIHFTDGYAYDASAFGSTDSTTGQWQINTSPSVTYGTNGFFILKDNGAKTDQSGNSNNFSEEGSPGIVSNTEDCPSNVFATLNPLDNKFSTDAVFSNGNNYVAAGGAGNGRFYSTLGMVSGKYYCEIKNVSGSGGTPLFAVAGTSNYALSSAGSPLSSQLYDYALYNGNVYNNDATVGGSWGTVSDGNIIGIAINLDNEQGGLNKLYFSINGVWQNGADPSNFTSATGVVGITKPENMAPGNPGYGVGAYFFACGDDNSYAERRFATNFGNGYFQTTAVSSAGTNASGIGIFEYDTPTGFTALSTKGLNL